MKLIEVIDNMYRARLPHRIDFISKNKRYTAYLDNSSRFIIKDCNQYEAHISDYYEEVVIVEDRIIKSEIPEKIREVYALAEQIKKDYPQLPAFEEYKDLLAAIKELL